MKVTTIKIKYLGKIMSFYRVLDNSGEVLKICETKEEAANFVNGL